MLIIMTAWRREARKEPSSRRKDERESHRQSDERWDCFKGAVGETSERRGGAYMGFPERIDTTLN